jgi:hypothetical protein
MKHYAIKTNGGWMYRSTFSWSRHWGALSASLPGRFTSGTHCVGGCVDPRTSLDDVKKTKFLLILGLELLPVGRSARSQSLYWLRYPGSPFLIKKMKRCLWDHITVRVSMFHPLKLLGNSSVSTFLRRQTHATIEELLDMVFSVWSLPYQWGK